MECLKCGGRYEEITEPVRLRVQGRQVVVDRAFYRCSACGDEMASLAQTGDLQRRAGAAIREREGLLLPAEITAIRESLGLSKAQFERLLGSGEKTAVRWEKGLVFQSQHANELMIALRDVPEFAAHLARRRGIVVRAGKTRDDETVDVPAIPFRSPPVSRRQRARKTA